MAKILKGKECADKITGEMILELADLKKRGIHPCLAILRIGENPDDLAYERGIVSRFEKIGLGVKKILLPSEASQEDVLSKILEINRDEEVQGALLFRPFPKGMDDTLLRNALAVEKDLDGIGDRSLAGIFTGSGQGFAPCTAEACLWLLKHYEIELAGREICVLGRSLVIGKPVAMLLLAEHATLSICHSRTANLEEVCRRADIVIAAVGKAQMIGKNFVREGQVLIDVGINVDEEGNLVGDADFSEVEGIVEAISPVPGGVGAVTTSVLAKHLIEACKRNR